MTRSTATSIQVALICLVFVGAVGIAGQTQTQSEATAVSLVPDKCPNVSPGQSISFDWNPLFDPAFPVTGLRDVGLTFSPVGGDGAGLRRGGDLHLGARSSAKSITALGNGFYHVEVQFRGPRIHAGTTYRLISARALAEVDPEFKGPVPAMTRSPVEDRFCFTVRANESSRSSSLASQ